MKKSESKLKKFQFDKDRGTSLVLLIDLDSVDSFQSSKFLKKFYAINTLKDEGETQSYSYLNSLKSIQKIKNKFSFGFDYVKIKSKGVSQITSELYEKNFGEIWLGQNEKYHCIADLNSQDEEDTQKSLSQFFGEGKIDLQGIVFEVVVF